MKSSFNNHFTLVLLLSFTVLIIASCQGVIKSLSDVSALRDELIREYKEQDINIVVQNSRVLGITFKNSTFNNLGPQERAIKAQEIALFARNHYASIKSIDKIWVSFVISGDYIVFHYSSSVGTYTFDTQSLTSPGAPNDVWGKDDVVASYHPPSNETNVYLKKNLQLYSDARSNVVLLPHFTIAGDKVSAPKMAVPKSVALDFTTFSNKRMFPDNPKLDIYVDGQRVFSGKARLTNVMGSNEEKSVNEFLSQEITYPQFLQLTNGTAVKIDLGTKQFELTGEHIKALQNMRRCVEGLR